MLWLRLSKLNLSSFPFIYSRDSCFLFYFEVYFPTRFILLYNSYCFFPPPRWLFAPPWLAWPEFCKSSLHCVFRYASLSYHQDTYVPLFKQFSSFCGTCLLCDFVLFFLLCRMLLDSGFYFSPVGIVYLLDLALTHASPELWVFLSQIK